MFEEPEPLRMSQRMGVQSQSFATAQEASRVLYNLGDLHAGTVHCAQLLLDFFKADLCGEVQQVQIVQLSCRPHPPLWL